MFETTIQDIETTTFGSIYLTKSEFDDVQKIFIKCFNSEIKRFEEKVTKMLIHKTVNIFGVLKLHTLLRDDTIRTVVQTVFNDSAMTDFILCLTDKFGCLTAVEEYADYKIAKTIANCFSAGSELEIEGYIPNNLIPEKIAANMALDKSLAEQVFITNRFYLVIALIVLFIGDTDAVDKDENTGKKK